MKILFIAPLPPPIHGQALASKVFLDEISENHDIMIVNGAKNKPKNIIDKVWRTFEVARILITIFKNQSKADLIYLTISESVLGNVKDLVTYLLCFSKLRSMTIHLHGGAGMIRIMKKRSLLASINAFFLKRLKNVIILGESHRPIFDGIVPVNRIHIVPNFAEDYLFAHEHDIKEKFQTRNTLNILFLSNLLQGKGYMELLNGYMALEQALKSKLRLNFAGAFGSRTLREKFFAKTKGYDHIYYHGVVRGTKKKKLLDEAHIFCLPTYYPYEGQPISILEAYASGCVVVTTDHSGIKDIFTNGQNGFEVKKKSSESIQQALIQILNDQACLLTIALFNRRTAEEQFKTSTYNSALKRIMGIK